MIDVIVFAPGATDTWEYRVVFDGYRESPDFHDWVDRETAEDEAEAFRGLGCENVHIKRRQKMLRCPRCKGEGVYITRSVGFGSPHICPQCHGKGKVARESPLRGQNES